MDQALQSEKSIWRIIAPAVIAAAASVILYLTGYIQGFDSLRAKSHELGALSEWTPRLAIGFLVDVSLTVASGLIGTVLGAIVGYALLSKVAYLRRLTWLGVQFLRNTPGLVFLFAVAFTLPYQFEIGTMTIPFPAWAKVIFCFSLKIAANVAEIVRGAVNSTPVGQWEAGASIGLSRFKIFRLVILPQCLPRMVPPWMNIMALFFTVVPIASLVGVYDAVNYAGLAINSEGTPALIMPIYLYVLAWFYCVAYMLQEFTRNLEVKTREKNR
jgi:polar amino acid transport system permease protein